MPAPDMLHHTDEGIGRRIVRKRRARGFTQQGLADRACVSKSLIQQIETGHRPATPSLVAAVAKALSVEPAELYGQPYRGDTAHTDRVHASIATSGTPSPASTSRPTSTHRPALWTP